MGEKLLEGPDFVQVTTDKVTVTRERLRLALSRQKSYVDKGKREYEPAVRDKVFQRFLCGKVFNSLVRRVN